MVFQKMPTPAKARHKGKTTKLRAWRALAAMKQFSIENDHAAANGGTLCSCVSIFENLSPLTMVGRNRQRCGRLCCHLWGNGWWTIR